MSISALVIKDFQKALFCCVWECVCACVFVCMCGCREGDGDRKQEVLWGVESCVCVCVCVCGHRARTRERQMLFGCLSACMCVCLTSSCMCVCVINALNQTQQSLHFTQCSLLLEHLHVIRRSLELGFQLVILTFSLLHHDLTVVPAYQR